MERVKILVQVDATSNDSFRKIRYSSILLKDVRKNITLYIFLLPALLYVLLFNYAPLYGIQIAFKEFNSYLGIIESPWVGFDNFIMFLNSVQFWNIIKNTLGISLYQLIAGFPLPIIMAIMVSYITIKWLKKSVQTITYVPHFISMVVMVGIILIMLSPHSGIVNIIIRKSGMETVNFMSKPALFRHIYVWSGIWQNAGFNSIIYIAVLASVSIELHEASIVDGANKVQRILHIDIPSLLPTAVILLILNMGRIMSVGFEKVFLMQNASNLKVSEIISTYVYKVGIQSARFSYSAAIGMFNNIINLLILILVNRVAKKLTDSSLW